MPKYILSSFAEADLEDIYVYTIKNWGVDQFQSYRGKINAALDAVGENPNVIGSKPRNDILKDCRFFPVEHHFLVYREVDGVIQIGRILHENMDFKKHISEEDFNSFA